MLDSNTYEILAPVGRIRDLPDIVSAGADAVYVGLSGFSSRPKQADLSVEEIREASDYCRAVGVPVYVAVNACIAEGQVPELKDMMQEINRTAAAGVILADYGLLYYYASLPNHKPIHASTLLGVNNSSSVRELRKEGVERIILSTNLTLQEMNEIIRVSDPSLDFEIVAEGGLCYNCNYQCMLPHFFDERGFHVYCQEEYELITDKYMFPAGKRIGHDLIHLGPVLGLFMGIGIHSFKIEGRTNPKERIIRSVRYVKECRDRFLEEKTELSSCLHYVCREWKKGQQ